MSWSMVEMIFGGRLVGALFAEEADGFLVETDAGDAVALGIEGVEHGSGGFFVGLGVGGGDADRVDEGLVGFGDGHAIERFDRSVGQGGDGKGVGVVGFLAVGRGGDEREVGLDGAVDGDVRGVRAGEEGVDSQGGQDVGGVLGEGEFKAVVGVDGELSARAGGRNAVDGGELGREGGEGGVVGVEPVEVDLDEGAGGEVGVLVLDLEDKRAVLRGEIEARGVQGDAGVRGDVGRRGRGHPGQALPRGVQFVELENEGGSQRVDLADGLGGVAGEFQQSADLPRTDRENGAGLRGREGDAGLALFGLPHGFDAENSGPAKRWSASSSSR